MGALDLKIKLGVFLDTPNVSYLMFYRNKNASASIANLNEKLTLNAIPTCKVTSK
jgi:hypothetical protein